MLIKYKPSDDQIVKLEALAKRKKVTMEAMANSLMNEAVARMLASPDLSIKEVSAQLGCSEKTIRRYRADGQFPSSYLVNKRVLRFPMKDIIRLRTA